MTDKYRKKYTLKIIAAVCAVTFFVQDLAMAAPGLASAIPVVPPMPQISFKLPESVGVIEDYWKASSSDAKLVVLIQDAHTNPSGQINLARALEQILPAESIQTVYTEGAEGDVSLRFLRDRVAPETIKNVTLEYLKKGIVKGDDYWNAVSGQDFRLWGVEDPELYRQSLEAYREVVKLRPVVRPYLDRILRSAISLQSSIYTPQITRLESLRRSNKSGELNEANYAGQLLDLAKAEGIDLRSYPQTQSLEKLKKLETRLDLKALAAEQDAALKSLSPAAIEELAPAFDEVQKNPIEAAHARVFGLLLEEKLGRAASSYPTLKKYFSYLHQVRHFNPLEMLREIGTLQEMLVRAASPDPDAVTLRETVMGLEALMDLIDLKVSAEEFDRLQSRGAFSDLRPLTGWINARLATDGHHPELAAFLDRRAFEAIRSAKMFYTLTRNRDQKMLDKLLSEMSANGESRAVLVAGGFHASGLKGRLKKAGISYVSILPQVLYETDTVRYEKLLLAQLRSGPSADPVIRTASVPLSDQVVGNIQKTLSSARLGAPLLGPDGPRLAAALGDAELTFLAAEQNRAVPDATRAGARMADNAVNAQDGFTSHHEPVPANILMEGEALIAEDPVFGKVVNPGILAGDAKLLLVDALKQFQKINILSENGEDWSDAAERGGILLLIKNGEITAAMRISVWENGAVAQADYLLSAYDRKNGKGSYLFKTALSEMRKRGVKAVYWTHDGESRPGFYQRRLAELVRAGVVENFDVVEIGRSSSIAGFRVVLKAGPDPAVNNGLYQPYSSSPFYPEIESKFGARMATDLDLVGKRVDERTVITEEALKRIRAFMGIDDLVADQRLVDDQEGAMSRAERAAARILRETQARGLALETMTQTQFNELFGVMPMVLSAGLTTRFSAYLPKHLAQGGMNRTVIGHALNGMYCSPGIAPVVFIGLKHLGLIVKDEYLRGYDADRHYFLVDPSITDYVGRARARKIDPKYFDPEKLLRYFGRSDMVMAFIKPTGHGDTLQQSVSEIVPDTRYPYLQVAFGETATSVLRTNSNASFITYLEIVATNADAVAGGRKIRSDEKVEVKGGFFFNGDPTQMMVYTDFEQIPHTIPTGKFDYVASQKGDDLTRAKAALSDLPVDAQARAERIRALRAEFSYFAISDDGVLFDQETLMTVAGDVRRWHDLTEPRKEWIRRHFAVHENTGRDDAEFLINANTGTYKIEALRNLSGEVERLRALGGFDQEGTVDARINLFWSVEPKNGGVKTLAWNYVRLLADHAIQSGRSISAALAYVGEHAPSSIKDAEALNQFANEAVAAKKSGLVEPPQLLSQENVIFENIRSKMVRGEKAAAETDLLTIASDPAKHGALRNIIRALFAASSSELWQSTLLETLEDVQSRVSPQVSEPGKGPAAHSPPHDQIVYGIIENLTAEAVDAGWIGNNPQALVSDPGYAGAITGLRNRYADELQRLRKKDLTIMTKTSRAEYLLARLSENIVSGLRDLKMDLGALLQLRHRFESGERTHVNVIAVVGSVDDGGHSELSKVALDQMGYGIIVAPGDPSNSMVGYMTPDKKAHLMGEGGRLEIRDEFARSVESFIHRTIVDPDVRLGPDIFIFMKMVIAGMINVDRINREALDLARDEEVVPHLDSAHASIRNIFNIGMTREAGLLTRPSFRNKGQPAIRTERDMERFQRAMISMAEGAGVTHFETTVSSFNPATLYAVYSGWTLMIRPPTQSENKMPLLPVAIEPMSNDRILITNPSAPESRVELGPGEEADLMRLGMSIEGIRIGNDGGFVCLNIEGRRWTADARDLNDIVIRNAQGVIKQLAYDSTGRDRHYEGVENEKPLLLTSSGYEVFLVPPVIKRQTFITEFQNHNKLRYVGLLDGYGLDGRIPSKKILQPPNKILLRQIREAALGDMIVVGPGSHWTSIVPHFLVDGFPRALEEAKSRGAEVVLMVNGVYDNETNGYENPEELLMTIEESADLPLDSMFSRIAVSEPESNEDLAERSGVNMETFNSVIHTPSESQLRTRETDASDAAKKGRALIYFNDAQLASVNRRWPGLTEVVSVPESLFIAKTQKRKAGQFVYRVVHSQDAVYRNVVLPATGGVRPRQIIAVTGGSAMSTLWARISERLMELPEAKPESAPGARMAATQSHDVRGSLMERIDTALGKGRFRVYPGGFASIDITPLGIDKRTALTDLMTRDGGKTHAVYFGDEFFRTDKKTGNDTPILTAKAEMTNKNIAVFSVDIDPNQRTEEAKQNTIWIGKGPEATRYVLREAIDAIRMGKKELVVQGQGPDAHKQVTLDLDALVRSGAMVFDIDGTVLESKKENFANQPEVRGLFGDLLNAGMTMAIISGNSRSEQTKRVSNELKATGGVKNLKMYVNGGATRMEFDPSGTEMVVNLSGDLSAEDIRRVAEVVAEAAKDSFGLSAVELSAWKEWFAFDGEHATRPDFPGVLFRPFWTSNNFSPDIVTSDEMARERTAVDTVSMPLVENRDNVQLSLKLFPKAVDLRSGGARMAAALESKRKTVSKTRGEGVRPSRPSTQRTKKPTGVDPADKNQEKLKIWTEASDPQDFALNRLADWFEANYGEPPVIETVFDDSHKKRFWATSLAFEGHELLIRLDDQLWRDTLDEGPAAYHIAVDRDLEGHQLRLEIKTDTTGRVDARRTIRSMYISAKRKKINPWVEPLLKRWVRSMNGLTLGKDNPLFNRHPMVAVAFDQEHPGFPIYRPTTYGSTGGGVRQIESPIGDPAALKAPMITEGKKTLIFYGGLGAVVPRFYMEYLKRLAIEYDVVFEAVDLLPEDAARQRIEAMELPYSAYHLASGYKIDPKNPPAGIVVLTRPDSHFDLTEWANANGVPVFVEKPITLPETVGRMRDHFRAHPDEMFAIDFFFDNPSAREALKLIDEGRIGRIQAIEGEMIEENGIESGREWLVTPHISGGGLGMDMLVHLTALSEMILERWGKSLRHAELDPKKILLARYEGAPAGTESYARLEGAVEKDVRIKFGAGKGLDRSAYYLVIKGDKGEIEINLGTENQKGFMEFRPSDGAAKIRIENATSDIGYDGTTKKIIHSLHAPGEVSSRERQFRMEATSLSVWLMNSAQVMHGPRYQIIPLHQDPAAIESQDVGQATLGDREQEALRDLADLSHSVEEYFEAKQMTVPLVAPQRGGKGVKNRSLIMADDYLTILLDGEPIIDLDPVQRTRRVTGFIRLSDPRIPMTELTANMKEAVEKAGWTWAGMAAQNRSDAEESAKPTAARLSKAVVDFAGSALREHGISKARMAYRENGARLAVYDLSLGEGALTINRGPWLISHGSTPKQTMGIRSPVAFDPSRIIKLKQQADARADQLAAGSGADTNPAALAMSVRVPVDRIFGPELTASEIRAAAQYLTDELLNIAESPSAPYAREAVFYFDPAAVGALERGDGSTGAEQERAMKDVATILRAAARKHPERFMIGQPTTDKLIVNWITEPLQARELKAGEFYVRIGRITRGVLPSFRMGLAVPVAAVSRTVGPQDWKGFFDLQNAEKLTGLVTVFTEFQDAGQLLSVLQGREPYQPSQFLRPLSVNAGARLIEVLRLTLTATSQSA